MKLKLLLLFVMLSSVCFAQTGVYPSSAIQGWDSVSQKWVPVKVDVDGYVFTHGGEAGSTPTGITEVATRTIELTTLDQSYVIESTLTSDNRQYIVVSTMNPDIGFWLNIGGVATAGECLRVTGWVKLDFPKDVVLQVMTNEYAGMPLMIIEGGN